MSRDISVGIATGCGDRIPVGAGYFTQSRPAHPASFTMGTGSFPGINRPGRGADHPSHSSARSRECRDIPLPPLWSFGSVRGKLSIYFVLYYCYRVSTQMQLANISYNIVCIFRSNFIVLNIKGGKCQSIATICTYIMIYEVQPKRF
jgi:hypothetical protein